ncbi:MAG TPA: hypothetical protein VEA69_24770, partial [Tepidisphaeraceae bacterium]|nr:hypothetical protein [Tepidisphaeraceae bacterium]
YEWPVKSFVAAGSCLIDLLTFGLASRVRDARARQAMEAACASPLWPFIRQADLDAALARPRLLSGRPPGRRE